MLGHNHKEENASTIADAQHRDRLATAAAAAESEDNVFHLGDAVVATWRLLHRQKERRDLRKAMDPSVLEQREIMTQSLNFLTKQEETQSPFLLIAFPDATQTLDTLQAALEPMLNKHPDGAILLVGLPGMPNTMWNKNKRLTAPFQARAAARLLAGLLAKPETGFRVSAPHHVTCGLPR